MPSKFLAALDFILLATTHYYHGLSCWYWAWYLALLASAFASSLSGTAYSRHQLFHNLDFIFIFWWHVTFNFLWQYLILHIVKFTSSALILIVWKGLSWLSCTFLRLELTLVNFLNLRGRWWLGGGSESWNGWACPVTTSVGLSLRLPWGRSLQMLHSLCTGEYDRTPLLSYAFTKRILPSSSNQQLWAPGLLPSSSPHCRKRKLIDLSAC